MRDGRALTAPNLGTELWAGFDLQTALAGRWGKPVRVMNDADVQGFGAVAGKGVEMVLTLGTGAGTSIFHNGQVMPHLELAHHPVRGDKTYDEYIGKRALENGLLCRFDPHWLAFGPALVGMDWHGHVAYWIGPLFGAAVAAILWAKILLPVERAEGRPGKRER